MICSCHREGCGAALLASFIHVVWCGGCADTGRASQFRDSSAILEDEGSAQQQQQQQEEGSTAAPLHSSAPPLDLAVLKKIVFAWVVTIPLAVALALAVYVPLRSVLSAELPPPPPPGGGGSDSH